MCEVMQPGSGSRDLNPGLRLQILVTLPLRKPKGNKTQGVMQKAERMRGEGGEGE